PRDELLTKRVWELQTDGSLERWRAIWADARAGHRQVDEGWYRRRDGSGVPLETSGDFVAYGGREWISVFARDVTDRRRVEQERAEHLAREQSLRARAEEAGVLKDQFLAALSHELRTPLASIRGYARMLLGGTVPGHAGRLQQNVRKLLPTAIKFAPPGGRVRVRVERADGEARLVVSDTGVGIAPAFLPHVFDRFRQADSSMTRVYGGVGLGLTLV